MTYVKTSNPVLLSSTLVETYFPRNRIFVLFQRKGLGSMVEVLRRQALSQYQELCNHRIVCPAQEGMEKLLLGLVLRDMW